MESIHRIRRLFRYLTDGRLDYFHHALWVRWNGLDFGYASLEDLGLSPGRSVHHAASGGIFLSDVMRQIDIPRGSRVVDLGCGKGSAVCTLATFPFDEVWGVEISESLARIAEHNSRKLKLPNVHVHIGDAGAFQDWDRFTHVYMFNPFPCGVMEEVMRNVTASLKRQPRPLTVIYFFPKCHDVIMKSGVFTQTMEVSTGMSHPYYVYVHQPSGARDSGDEVNRSIGREA